METDIPTQPAKVVQATGAAAKPWYRESWLYLACLLFFFPGFVALIVTDRKQSPLLKIILVGVQLAACSYLYWRFTIR